MPWRLLKVACFVFLSVFLCIFVLFLLGSFNLCTELCAGLHRETECESHLLEPKNVHV